MPDSTSEPLKLFYCYAHVDKALRDELDEYLAGMKRQRLLEVWYDRQIMAGIHWENEISKNLMTANIILLLVSPSFMNLDYCYGVEMETALQLNAEGLARVIPILLRPTDWEEALFSHLQVLPTGAKPVTKWQDKDDAFKDITTELRKVVKELRPSLKEKVDQPSLVQTKEQYNFRKTKEEWLEKGNALNNLKRYEEARVAFQKGKELGYPSWLAALSQMI